MSIGSVYACSMVREEREGREEERKKHTVSRLLFFARFAFFVDVLTFWSS